MCEIFVRREIFSIVRRFEVLGRSPVPLLAFQMFRTPEVGVIMILRVSSFPIAFSNFHPLSLILLNQTFLSHQPTNMPEGSLPSVYPPPIF